MASVSASDIKKNFGEWYDKASGEPVEITRDGRATAFLVSASLYRDMLASYRKVVRVGDLDDETMALIRSAAVDTSEPYNLEDLPESDEAA